MISWTILLAQAPSQFGQKYFWWNIGTDATSEKKAGHCRPVGTGIRPYQNLAFFPYYDFLQKEYLISMTLPVMLESPYHSFTKVFIFLLCADNQNNVSVCSSRT